MSNLSIIIHINNTLYGNFPHILSVMNTVFGILLTLSPSAVARRGQI